MEWDADTQKHVAYMVVAAIFAGIAWIAKSIVKPWSDAALMRSKAFVDHVEKISPALEKFVAEHEAHGETLIANGEELEKQSGLLQQVVDSFGSDPHRLCEIAKLKEKIKVENGLDLTTEEILMVMERNRKDHKNASETKGAT